MKPEMWIKGMRVLNPDDPPSVLLGERDRASANTEDGMIAWPWAELYAKGFRPATFTALSRSPADEPEGARCVRVKATEEQFRQACDSLRSMIEDEDTHGDIIEEAKALAARFEPLLYPLGHLESHEFEPCGDCPGCLSNAARIDVAKPDPSRCEHGWAKGGDCPWCGGRIR